MLSRGVVVRLANKAALITGGGSGIGRASALLFAKEGARVAVVDRDAEAGQGCAEEIQAAGGQAVFIEADVSKVVDTRRMVEQAVAQFGTLNVLFNNAGIELFRTTEETTEEEFDRVTAVNMKGVFFGSQAAVEPMRAAGGGSIIHTSSVNALQGGSELVAYSATKGGVTAMTVAMAKDLARYGIRVNCILPAGIDTPMNQRWLSTEEDPDASWQKLVNMHTIKRIGTPEDVAAAALWLASDESAWVTGISLPVDGGFLCNSQS
jgi:NAD(P)-dependent dehydrogenase (short-subunit alcohol dehydrogenase family)